MTRPDGDLAARMAGSPVYGMLGLVLVEAGDGRATLALDCDRRHANVDGAVHGGLLAFVADTAMGLAVRTQIDAAWPNKTLQLAIDLVRGARSGERLLARARVDEASRRFRWASAELEAAGRVVARARSLNLVEPPG
jgi:acyl-CoA thioesterase